MDAKELKEQLGKVVAAFQAEGTPLSFAGITPAYPGLRSTSYNFQVSGSFLEHDPKAIDTVVNKLFENVPEEVRRHIHAVQVYDPSNTISAPLLYPTEDWILVNELNYKPDPVKYYYSLQEQD
jgi:hypothetical protein